MSPDDELPPTVSGEACTLRQLIRQATFPDTGTGEASLLGDEVRRRVEDGLDVVAVRIEDEPGVVVAAVLGTHTRGSDVCPAMVHCSVVPAHDRTGVACTEGNVRTGGHPVAAGLAADRVQAEVIAVAAPEQDVAVTLELAFGQHHESDFRQRRFVHPSARRQVADPDTDVVDNLAHWPFNPLSAELVGIDEP
jgi:hypothetical protein